MFLFKKKSRGDDKGGKKNKRADFPGFDGGGSQPGEDADLEAELLALTGGSKSDLMNEGDLEGDDVDDLDSELARILGETKRKPKPKKLEHAQEARQKQSSQDESADDDDDDIDENDPELLGELQELTGENCVDESDDDGDKIVEMNEDRIPSQMELIADRLQAYKDLASAATKAGDSARQRRFNRGIKTLEKQLREARSGKVIPPDEIPPEVARPKANLPQKVNISTSGSEEPLAPMFDKQTTRVKDENSSGSLLETVQMRLSLYREAEQLARAGNDLAKARRFNRGVKTLEMLLKQLQAGHDIFLDDIPPEISKPKLINTSEPLSNINQTIDEGKADTIILEPDRLDEDKNSLVKNTEDPVPENELEPSGEDVPSQLFNNDVSPSPKVIETDSTAASTADASRNVPIVISKPQVDEVANCSEPLPKGMQQILEERRDEYKKFALQSKKNGDLQNAIELVRSVKKLDGLITLVKAGKEIRDSDIPIPLTATSTAPVTVKFPIPKTVLESLQQRLAYYTKAEQTARLRGDAIKLKRNSGIVQIYKNAIKLHEKGSSVPYERLPTPPGCPPIPLSFKI